MKNIIEKLQRAEQAEQHAKAQQAKIQQAQYLRDNEKIHARAQEHLVTTRRKFLDMVKNAGISSSLLRASSLVGGLMASRYAQAAGGGKHVFYCYVDSGAASGAWMPRSATAMNTVTKAYGPDGTNVAGLCNFRQVDVILNGHAAARQALGVTNSGATMDARIAPLLSAAAPYRSIYLGSLVNPGTNPDNILCSTIGPVIEDPVDAYKRYFASPLPAGSTDDTYLKVFDSHQKALALLRNKLSQEEKSRMDEHADALNGLENRLTALMAGTGPDIESYRPTLPSASTYVDRMVSHGKLQADILIAAIQAGLTNVGILQLGSHQGGWHGEGISYQGTLHDSAHNTPTDPSSFNAMISNVSQVPAYIIKRLTEASGSDGQKLIDNTVFVQVTCMGNGMTHNSADAPFIVATRMPGFTRGFSASVGGTTEDLNGAIPKGLGLAEGSYVPMGKNTLGLVG